MRILLRVMAMWVVLTLVFAASQEAMSEPAAAGARPRITTGPAARRRSPPQCPTATC